MCLDLRSRSKQPYADTAKSDIRYKVVFVSTKRLRNGKEITFYKAPYRSNTYTRSDWNIATDGEKSGPKNFGFHMFVNRWDADYVSYNGRAVKRVRVSGFLRSGKFLGRRCETWRKMKFID